MTGLPIEQESLLRTIFTDYDSFIQTSVIASEPVRMLGDLEISDRRIQSLIREKDVEILNLRNKIISVEKEKSKVSTGGQLHALDELRNQNQNLMNQIAQLRVEKGSSELVANYKGEIRVLNERILELEQEKSNLSAELSNLRREYEAKLSIYENMKNLGGTQVGGDSVIKSPNMRSPVQQYEVQSPEYSARMVESEYRKT
jgi:archaellum component FlaC